MVKINKLVNKLGDLSTILGVLIFIHITTLSTSFKTVTITSRNLSKSSNRIQMKGLILGAYESGTSDQKVASYSRSANHVLKTIPKLGEVITRNIAKFGPVKKGKARVLQDIVNEYPVVSLVGLGPEDAGVDLVEQLDEKKENVRLALADGLKAIRALDIDGLDEVDVDDCGEPQAAAESVYLANFRFDELKNEKSRHKQFRFNLYNSDPNNEAAWTRGRIIAEGQNLARRLADMPANFMTPTIFAEEVTKLAANSSVRVIVHDKEWAESKKMGAFLSVTQGSDQPPKFVELHYNNKSDSKPLVFVGKGITFDTGGVSLKSPANMDEMRADMTGAAIVATSIITLARLGAKVNIIGLIPLSENTINGHATKPGDVFRAMNGKTIQVDNTDAEGRLVLADALTYADTFEPQAVVDIATLTGAMTISFGSALSGVWSTNEELWRKIYNASIVSGDRVWRMPLFKAYTKEVTECHLADLNNMGKTPRAAGSQVGAAFLKEFTTCPNWMHIDIASVMWYGSDRGYMSAGMTARPFRTVIPFFESVFQNSPQ